MRDKHYDKEEQKAVQSALAKMEMEDPQIKKWKQQMAELDDKIARKKKEISEKERKKRTRRLIVLGAIVEDALGVELPDGSDELEALVRYYLPLIRSAIDNGKLYERLKKIREEDEKKKEEQEENENADD